MDHNVDTDLNRMRKVRRNFDNLTLNEEIQRAIETLHSQERVPAEDILNGLLSIFKRAEPNDKEAKLFGLIRYRLDTELNGKIAMAVGEVLSKHGIGDRELEYESYVEGLLFLFSWEEDEELKRELDNKFYEGWKKAPKREPQNSR